MTASTPEKLTDTDLDLLVRWMTGDHTASKVPDYPNQMDAVKAAISQVAVDERHPFAEVRPMIITLDGPAGSGKSTVARLLAERMSYRFLDTGAMYRAVRFGSAESGR
jgi:pantothenate kinase-related protein Tda10